MTSIPARAIARQYADLRLIQDFFKLVCFTSASSDLEPGQAFTSGKDWRLRSSKNDIFRLMHAHKWSAMPGPDRLQ